VSSTEERNAKDDLALCDKATPGPWGICLGSGAHVCTGVMQDGEEDFGTMICDCLPDYFLKPAVEKPGDHRHNMRFIAMAREALPYWIERAQKLERALRLACEECDGESHVRGCLMFGDPE